MFLTCYSAVTLQAITMSAPSLHGGFLGRTAPFHSANDTRTSMASATKIVKKVQKVAKSVAKSAGYKKFQGRASFRGRKKNGMLQLQGHHVPLHLWTTGDALWLPNTERPAWLDGTLPGDRGFDPLGLAKPAEYLQVWRLCMQPCRHSR